MAISIEHEYNYKYWRTTQKMNVTAHFYLYNRPNMF